MSLGCPQCGSLITDRHVAGCTWSADHPTVARSIKLVGGECDGRYGVLKSGEGDYFALKYQTPVVEYGPVMAEPSLNECGSVVTRHRYTLRAIRIGGQPFLEFLAPDDWSDQRAIAFQFEK